MLRAFLDGSPPIADGLVRSAPGAVLATSLTVARRLQRLLSSALRVLPTVPAARSGARGTGRFLVDGNVERARAMVCDVADLYGFFAFFVCASSLRSSPGDSCSTLITLPSIAFTFTSSMPETPGVLMS